MSVAYLGNSAEFDTKGRFLPISFAVLVGINIGALCVLVFDVLPRLPELFFDWKLELLTLACLVLPILGITLEYHRGETHGGFTWAKWATPLRVIIIAFGEMAFQGAIPIWALRHRPHHKFVDQPADSHTPMRYSRENKDGVDRPTWKGFWWAHTGTYFYEQIVPPPPRGDSYKGDSYDELIASRREYWIGDLEADPVIRRMAKLYVPLMVLRFAIPFMIAGWDGLLIAGLLTAVVMHHITWCTNSVAHMWGPQLANQSKNGKKLMGTSRNVPWRFFLWLLSFGESWHNNHHRLDRCVAHGWNKRQIDITKHCIRRLEKLGCIGNVKWYDKQRAEILADERAPADETSEAAMAA